MSFTKISNVKTFGGRNFTVEPLSVSADSVIHRPAASYPTYVLRNIYIVWSTYVCITVYCILYTLYIQYIGFDDPPAINLLANFKPRNLLYVLTSQMSAISAENERTVTSTLAGFEPPDLLVFRSFVCNSVTVDR